MKYGKLQITQEDIDQGTKHVDSCPLARAVCRALKLPTGSVQVCSGFWAHIPGGDKMELGEAGEKFVYRFDTGLPVEPFTLEYKTERLS